MKLFIKIVNKFILIFLILCLIFVVYSKYVMKKSVVKLFGYAILVVCTDSMEPNISRNELIVIKEEQNYSLGDIVTYKDSQNVLITHRVITMDRNGVVTKGDNNVSADRIVDVRNIKGKVIFHSKVLGVFVRYIKFILLLYIAIVLMILSKSIMPSQIHNSFPTREGLEGRSKNESKEY